MQLDMHRLAFSIIKSANQIVTFIHSIGLLLPIFIIYIGYKMDGSLSTTKWSFCIMVFLITVLQIPNSIKSNNLEKEYKKLIEKTEVDIKAGLELDKFYDEHYKELIEGEE